MAKYDTLVMCSGGIDSVVMLYKMMNEDHKCRMVYEDFGKRVTNQELAVVKRLSLDLDVPLTIIDVHGLAALQSAFVAPIQILEEELDIDIGKHPKGGARGDDKYVTGFPCLLSIASYAALLTDGVNVATAVTRDQFNDFPTIQEAFARWEETLELFSPGVPKLNILSPVINKTKSELVTLGVDLGVPLERTWSCVASTSFIQCGSCHQCIARKKAFSDAGVPDGTSYET